MTCSKTNVKKNNDFYSSGFVHIQKLDIPKIKVDKNYQPTFCSIDHNLNQAPPAVKIIKNRLDANKRGEILQGNNDHVDAKFTEGQTMPADQGFEQKQEQEEDVLKGTKHLLIEIPFKTDKNKIQRFKNYIQELETNVIITDTSSNMMTGSQLK